jgi:chitin disaccharide deacetylase
LNFPNKADSKLPSTSDRKGIERAGKLIINADDWGRDVETTQRINDCTGRGTVTAVSAMVFMADSARAAEIAKKEGIDAGLHLNLTMPFTSTDCPSEVADGQKQLVRYLRGSRFARVIFNPLLTKEFEYVVSAQIDEYRRLYGGNPARIDGHHHMHLCSNVLFGRLLPTGTSVRRNFSFDPGEKSRVNRSYRKFVDRLLAGRHRLTDYFYTLPPMEPAMRLVKIFSLARDFVVEVETHPINSKEYSFLMGEEILQLTAKAQIALS